MTKELFKKKLEHQGNLQKRDVEHVCISVKGRIVRIPSELIDSVKLKKAKYEANDREMEKLK